MPQSLSKIIKASCKCGTVYFYYTSDFVCCDLKTTKDHAEKIEGKHKFEYFLKTNGTSIRVCRDENHTHYSNLFRQNNEATGQCLSFYGVDAHHLNLLSAHGLTFDFFNG